VREGKIIFEMTAEEKQRRGLHHSTLDIGDAAMRAGDETPPLAECDEQVRAMVPKASKHPKKQLILRDEGAQAESRAEDWIGFDVGNALARLRSDKGGVRLRALRQLHLRWHHAPVEHMEKILRAAGVPSDILDQVSHVVHTCRICRRWE